MIPIKTKKEIAIMKKGGRILARVMAIVIENTQPGIKTKALDVLAEKLIIKNGGKSSFKMVKGYSFTSCININDGLVHGIPGEYKIKTGDVVTIDLGAFYKGFHSDMARTFQVAPGSSTSENNTSKVSEDFTLEVKESEVNRFLKIGRLALKKTIATTHPGNHIGHISKAIQEVIEGAGYSCSRKFTGHGIGEKLHEEPKIPCFLEGKTKNTPRLKPGMVLAIEVIYSQGRPEIKLAKDGWTAKTIDGKLGGLFENTVAVTEVGSIVLTVV